MRLTSSAFSDGDSIPLFYSGLGRNLSPALEWQQAPSGTKSFVLIMEDPDAPKGHGKDHPFVHWLVYGLPSTVRFLPEGLPNRGELSFPVSCKQGKNSFGNLGYDGPLPPVGHGIHDYLFTLHALDTELDLPPGASKQEILDAMDNHILHSTKIVGSFERKADDEGIEEDREAG